MFNPGGAKAAKVKEINFDKAKVPNNSNVVLQKTGLMHKVMADTLKGMSSSNAGQTMR